MVLMLMDTGNKLTFFFSFWILGINLDYIVLFTYLINLYFFFSILLCSPIYEPKEWSATGDVYAGGNKLLFLVTLMSWNWLQETTIRVVGIVVPYKQYFKNRIELMDSTGCIGNQLICRSVSYELQVRLGWQSGQ